LLAFYSMFNVFNLRLRHLILLTVAVVLPLISINVEQKKIEENWLNKPFDLLAESIQYVFFSFSSGIRSTTSDYLNLLDIKRENADLRSKNSEMSIRVTQLNEVLNENERFRKLLEFKEASSMKLVAAQIMGGDILEDHRTVTINKGTVHGLMAGQGVITLEGVLGYVFRPQMWTSRVILLEDRYSVVDSVIQRTRAHGIVEGRGSGGCTLKYVERSEDVRVGDIVVTGGLDQIFPKGFPVAVVESVERKTYSVSLKVDLRPVVNPNKVEEVFVIFNSEGADLTDKFSSQESKAPSL
jgi:rod shape-determining protein MreC